MALSPLITEADLQARGIDTTDTDRTTALIDAASAAVRAAAGSPITETTATISLPTPEGRRLALPGPVREVAAVTVAGEPVEDYQKSGNSLWRGSWGARWALPGEVEVTLTFGLAEAPADVVDLVCNLVGAGLAHIEDGYTSRAGVVSTSEQIDDYSRSVQYAQGGSATTTPLEIPEGTRRALRRRFGMGVAVMVVSRS